MVISLRILRRRDGSRSRRLHGVSDLVEHGYGVVCIAVIGDHHSPAQAKTNRGLVALVGLVDLLCRMRGLGYGYAENRIVNLLEEEAYATLQEECPSVRGADWTRITFELDNYMYEVHNLVAALYRLQ